ncbi:MAG: hypothetical protein CMG08_03440 [Candidatus Marinimicrobia bacterium]|nr:hypothetical protein [Candidatus Neomarinimicrobiota bacterium]
MANELEIHHDKDIIYINCLDEKIFKDKLNDFLKQGYAVLGMPQKNKFGLFKVALKKSNV